MKNCCCCGVEQELAQFCNDRRALDGKVSRCRDCTNKAQNARRARLKQVPEEAAKLREARRAIYARTREVVLAYRRTLTADQRRADRSRYYARHRERIVAKAIETVHVRRALKAGGAGISLEQWRALVSAYDGRCAYCGVAAKLSRDHVQPLSRSGKHDLANIVPACRRCNSSKNNKTLSEWLSMGTAK